MGEQSPFKDLEQYEYGPDDQCIVHFLDEQQIEGTAHVCKQVVGNGTCYAIGLNKEGIIYLDGVCAAFNSNNTATQSRN
jgi:hypothetical protein